MGVPVLALEEAQSRNGSRLGGITAILIGLLNVVLVIYVVSATGEQRYDTEQSLTYYATNPLGLSAAFIVFTLTATLAYAVIPAASDLVQAGRHEWGRAATLYGLVGYTVLGLWAVTQARSMPELAQQFVAADEATRKVILALGLPEIDPAGWFSFGGPGTWLIVINILGLRTGRLAKLHAVAGILLGIGHWSTLIAGVFEFEPLNLFAAGTGAIFYPIWYIWMGIRLLRPSP